MVENFGFRVQLLNAVLLHWINVSFQLFCVMV